MIPINNKKEVHALIGLVNYYRDMWTRRLNLIQPLTALTSNKVKFKLIDAKQHTFDKIKQLVACNTLLIYPDFNELFYIHRDARNFN